jgi:hypothetical protein
LRELLCWQVVVARFTKVGGGFSRESELWVITREKESFIYRFRLLILKQGKIGFVEARFEIKSWASRIFLLKSLKKFLLVI